MSQIPLTGWVGGLRSLCGECHSDYKTNLSSQLNLYWTGQLELSLAIRVKVILRTLFLTSHTRLQCPSIYENLYTMRPRGSKLMIVWEKIIKNVKLGEILIPYFFMFWCCFYRRTKKEYIFWLLIYGDEQNVIKGFHKTVQFQMSWINKSFGLNIFSLMNIKHIRLLASIKNSHNQNKYFFSRINCGIAKIFIHIFK